jgi:hypothetical protein
MSKISLHQIGTKTILILALITLGACASPYVNLTELDRSAIRKVPVINVVRYVSPAPYIQTPSSVAGFGLITSATDSQKLPGGGQLVSKYQYPEPTQLVASRVAEQLRTQGRLNNVLLVTTAEPLPVKDDFAQYRSRFTSGIILEINMAGGYMMSYLPVNWKTYQFAGFGIRARMIDPKDGRILWSGYCDIGREPNTKLTLDITEFEANNGARAKEVIQNASRICGDHLVSQILGNTQ